MIVFILYVFLLIYIFEFYNYIYKLKKQLNTQSPITNNVIEKFDNIAPECKILPADYIDMSENVMEPQMISYDSLKKIKNNKAPLPADDTRAYFNPDFHKLMIDKIPSRQERDKRWHCIREYMICDTPYNFLPQLEKGIYDTSQIWKNYLSTQKC